MRPFGWTTEQVLTATGGSHDFRIGGQAFAGIGIDSRTIGPDDLFVAIAGESHDGHRFVADVLDRGVKGVVAADDQVASLPTTRMAAANIACIAVADTTRALGAMARFNRNRGNLKVVAITGSNGKTSTRMLMDQVMSRTFSTLSTSGNLNNHIGLPLTLFRLTPGHQAAVLELGMNHAGEITRLGRICEPDVGVITNVGPAHLEGLGTIENVARAKGELLDTIRPGGTAILNADDPRVAAMARRPGPSGDFFRSCRCGTGSGGRYSLHRSGHGLYPDHGVGQHAGDLGHTGTGDGFQRPGGGGCRRGHGCAPGAYSGGAGSLLSPGRAHGYPWTGW